MASVTVLTACRSSMDIPSPSPAASRDINAVLADHDDRLLALPGVVGVYVGLLDDGRTPCLGVMLARRDRDLMRALPREIEGYPVRIVVTGELEPLNRDH
jgi:hypothetical protein